MKIFKSLLSALFPKTCFCCGKIINENEFLCNYCYEMLEKSDLSKMCIKCGRKKKNCVCVKAVFCFDGCVSSFLNDGVAKRVMRKFKFGKKPEISEFFAQYMSLSVLNAYKDLKFDGICFVPMHKRKVRRRGFNQSEEIARNLSAILKIPVFSDAVICVKYRKSQHKLNAEKRLKNVKGLYKGVKNLSGKRILLVDDIKTTGATLNEIARQIINSGAASVHCVTALATEKLK